MLTITAYLISGWHISKTGYPFLRLFLDKRRILLVPEFALLEGEDYEPGAENVVVRLKQCEFTTEVEQRLWLEQMAREANEIQTGT